MLYQIYYRKDIGIGSGAYSLDADNLNPEEYLFIAIIKADGLDDVFRHMNVVDGDEEKEYPINLKCRSMCVGDVVCGSVSEPNTDSLVTEPTYTWLCSAIGWRDAKLPTNWPEARHVV